MARNYGEYEEMLRAFRCQDLITLLTYAGQSKNGKKQELYDRCIILLQKGGVNIQLKIREIYNKLGISNGYSALLSSASNSSSSNSPIGGTNGTRYPSSNQPGLLGPGGYANQFGFNHPGLMHHPHIPTHIPTPNGHPYHSLAPINPAITSSLNRNMGPANVTLKIQFEKLAFYEHLFEILAPIKMIPNNPNTRPLCFSFSFVLSIDQVNQILETRKVVDAKFDYSKQVHIRFGYYDTHIQSDTIPANLILNVNGKPAQLPTPKPTSKPNADIIRPGRSIDVTHICKLAPNFPNKVDLNWTNLDPNKAHCVGVYFYRKVSVTALVENLKKNCIQEAEITRQMVREKLQISDDGLEIETNELKVSLQCPLMKFKINLPGRSVECKHVQCFDIESYLMMNEKKPTWNCPVCDRHTPYDKLIICGLFKEILAKVNDCEEIVFAPDATWTKFKPSEKEKSSKKIETKTAVAEEEVCDLIDEDDEDEEDEKEKTQEKMSNNVKKIESTISEPTATSSNQNKEPLNDDVIDLTADSDEENEQINSNRNNNNQIPFNISNQQQQTTNNSTNELLPYLKTMRSFSESSTNSATNNNNNLNLNGNNLQRGTVPNANFDNGATSPTSPSISIISLSSSESRSQTPVPQTPNMSSNLNDNINSISTIATNYSNTNNFTYSSTTNSGVPSNSSSTNSSSFMNNNRYNSCNQNERSPSLISSSNANANNFVNSNNLINTSSPTTSSSTSGSPNTSSNTNNNNISFRNRSPQSTNSRMSTPSPINKSNPNNNSNNNIITNDEMMMNISPSCSSSLSSLTSIINNGVTLNTNNNRPESSMSPSLIQSNVNNSNKRPHSQVSPTNLHKAINLNNNINRIANQQLNSNNINNNTQQRPNQNINNKDSNQQPQKKSIEHTLVNSANSRINNQKLPNRQNEYMNKEKVARALEQLKETTSHNNNNNNNNPNFQLKETNLSSKIQNSLRRNSFDTDLPPNKKNTQNQESNNRPINNNPNKIPSQSNMIQRPQPINNNTNQQKSLVNNNNNQQPFFINNNNNMNNVNNKNNTNMTGRPPPLMNLHQHQPHQFNKNIPQNSNYNSNNNNNNNNNNNRMNGNNNHNNMQHQNNKNLIQQNSNNNNLIWQPPFKAP